MKKTEKTIEMQPIIIKTATIYVEGDTDLVLNRMSARSVRELTSERNNTKTVKQVPNKWEDIITAIHWRDPLPVKDTYTECNEELLKELLEHNAPCIPGFGFKKSFNQAVVRNEIATYCTKFDTTVNTINRLEPIKFATHYVDERLMSPKKGSPVLVRLNRFSGWSSQIHIAYTEHVYKLDQIVNIINMAGFGGGVGSGRSSGYGRFHVVGIEAEA